MFETYQCAHPWWQCGYYCESHTSNVEYSSASAYDAQFFKAMLTSFNKIVWKYWATPKVKFFSWLAIRNRIWMADCPERRGWDNCDLCPLCKQTQETVAHLLSHCRYTKRLWEMLKSYLNISSIKTNKWTTNLSIDEWWSDISCEASPNQKALATLTMLMSWTIWKERNARVKIIKPQRCPFSLRLSRAKQDFGLP
jgi:hypothetical protein